MKRVLFFCLLLRCLIVPGVDALDFQIPELVDMSGFGTLLGDVSNGQPHGKSLQTGAVYGRVPRSDLMLKSATADITAPSSGSVIYVQADAPVKTLFSFPLGGAMAIFHPERYVSVISGLDTSRIIQSAGANQSATPRELIVKKGDSLPGGSGSGMYPPNVFGLRLFDAQNLCWVNPIFLSSWIRDQTPPVIRTARLTKSGDSALIDISGVAARDTRITCAQGNYRIYIDAFDTIVPGSPLYSAPYRFLALLDGKSVVDSSFATAKCTEDGLSFLGNAGSSREAVTADGLYSVGTIALVRGEHDLQLLVSDYAGNTSMLKASIIVR
ncbi:MAG: hypothetical protein ABFC65_08450 [Rectinema sp.]